VARIALLTLEDRTGYVIDDALAVDALRSRGHDVDEVPWSRPDPDWSAYALVVVRTPWDYTERPGAFLDVLAEIEARGVPLENRRSVVAWNLHKGYLRELEERGVPIVPTTWGKGADSLRALRARMSGRFVVKPVIGANARDTFVIDEGDAAIQRVAAIYASREWMAQPFVRSVVEDGEHSLFYFSGVLSHAIVKSPAPGDFRVQEEHGGIIRPIEPPADLRAAADRVLLCLPEPLLQARIDLVRLDDGTPALMEAELIEPSLYFRMHTPTRRATSPTRSRRACGAPDRPPAMGYDYAKEERCDESWSPAPTRGSASRSWRRSCASTRTPSSSWERATRRGASARAPACWKGGPSGSRACASSSSTSRGTRRSELP